MAEKVSYTVVDQGASTHYTLDWETFVASLDRIWEPSWTVWLFSTQCFYWPAIYWAHQHFIGVPFTPETSQHSCDGRWPRERKSQNRWGQCTLYVLRCVNWHKLIRRNSSIEPCAYILNNTWNTACSLCKVLPFSEYVMLTREKILVPGSFSYCMQVMESWCGLGMSV